MGALLLTLVLFSSPARAADTLFAGLVNATESGDQGALLELLSSETLSTASTVIGTDGRVTGGDMRHGVPVAEIAPKLAGCVVERWRDEAIETDGAFVLWRCPQSRVASDPCYFHVYRASMLDARWHPRNLFVHEMAQRDIARCGTIIVPPPRY